MRLKITSDGTPHNTHVIDIETGERVENVQRVEWSVDVRDRYPVARAQIVIIDIPVDVKVSGKTTIYEKSVTIEHE